MDRDPTILEKFVLYKKVGHDQTFKKFRQETLTVFFGGLRGQMSILGVFLSFCAFDGPYGQLERTCVFFLTANFTTNAFVSVFSLSD